MNKLKKKQKTHLKIGDEVKVITGKEKGKIGKVLSLNKKTLLAQVDGMITRERYYTKVEKQKALETSKTEEILEKKILPRFIHTSNLMIWDVDSKQASRIGYKVWENKKMRYFKKSGKTF